MNVSDYIPELVIDDSWEDFVDTTMTQMEDNTIREENYVEDDSKEDDSKCPWKEDPKKHQPRREEDVPDTQEPPPNPNPPLHPVRKTAWSRKIILTRDMPPSTPQELTWLLTLQQQYLALAPNLTIPAKKCLLVISEGMSFVDAPNERVRAIMISHDLMHNQLPREAQDTRATKNLDRC